MRNFFTTNFLHFFVLFGKYLLYPFLYNLQPFAKLLKLHFLNIYKFKQVCFEFF